MKSRTNVKRFLVDWAAVLALLVCFIAFTAVKGSAFMSGSNMVNILRAMAINTVFGIAATITMAPDGFDMSAGTLASCSAYVFVSAYLWLGMSLGMSIVTCIFVTLIMYQLTMFLILVCKIPDMLATCALMFVHQGIGQWYIGGGAVSTGMKTSWGAMPARTALSESFSAIGRAPWIIIIMLGCVFVAYLFLNFTKHGRYLYAMGGNEKAAKLSGINTNRTLFFAYTNMGFLSAVAALVCIARFNSAAPSAGTNYELDAIGACYIGGASAYGGTGTIGGAVIGAIFMGVLNNGMSILGIDSNWQGAVKGLVLLAAVVFDVLSKKRSAKA